MEYKQKRNNEIREAYRNGKTIAELARDFGVTRQRIYEIVNNEKRMNQDDVINKVIKTLKTLNAPIDWDYIKECYDNSL